jgi:hypothetical protein
VPDRFFTATQKNAGVLPLKFCGVAMVSIVTPDVLAILAILFSPNVYAYLTL